MLRDREKYRSDNACSVSLGIERPVWLEAVSYYLQHVVTPLWSLALSLTNFGQFVPELESISTALNIIHLSQYMSKNISPLNICQSWTKVCLIQQYDYTIYAKKEIK